MDARTVAGCLVAGAMALGAAVHSTHGLVVADFNDMTPGEMKGQVGGSGFDPNETWDATNTLRIVEGDLSSPLYNITQSGPGQSAQGIHGSSRYITRPFETPMVGEIWFSFLVNMAKNGDRAGIGLNPTTSLPYNAVLFQMGNPNGDLTVRRDDISTWIDTGIGFGETALVVGRLILTDSSDDLTVWFNPNLIDDPNIENHTPIFSSADRDFIGGPLTHFGVVSYDTTGGGSGAGGLVDAVRFSDSDNAFYDVTGIMIPEPSSMLLMGMGTLLMLRRVRS